MSVATLCKPIQILGGQNPQSMTMQFTASSLSANTTSITVYHKVNNGAPLSPQVTPATGQIFVNYNETVTGLVAGDIVSICIEADISTNVGDTGRIRLNGTFTQIDALGCEKQYEAIENCDWTAYDPDAVDPTCPDNTNIDCENLPVTISGFADADSIAWTSNVSPSAYTVTPNGANTEIEIDGNGGNEVITVTVTNDNGSCQFIAGIAACAGPLLPPSSCETLVIFQPNQPGQQCLTRGTFTGGSGSISLSSPDMPFPFTFTDNGDGTWDVCVPSGTGPTGAQVYTVIADDGVNPSLSCGPHNVEVVGLI